MSSNLNKDVVFLILKELQNDRGTLHSCLFVNKAWCEIIVPMLWKNPWKYLTANTNIKVKISLLNVIVSHLSNETKEILKKNLKSQDIVLSAQQRPLFNYISFCRYLKLHNLDEIIVLSEDIENPEASITHLYIPLRFNYQIHLIPGAECCFSQLKFIHCSTSNTNLNILEGLSKISKSIEKLSIETS